MPRPAILQKIILFVTFEHHKVYVTTEIVLETKTRIRH
jgi:hypothetical protein